MNKFLWFLGGGATGLLIAAAISALNENCASSSSFDDDEDAALESDDSTTENTPIFPGKHFKATSGPFANMHTCDCRMDEAQHAGTENSDIEEPSHSPA